MREKAKTYRHGSAAGFLHQVMRKSQKGRVMQERAWVVRTSPAPRLQSSPTSLGNTMVFKPQGIQVTMMAKSITSSSPNALQMANAIKGMRTRRNREKTYRLFLFKRALRENAERLIPTRSILKGPTHPEAEDRMPPTMAGSFNPLMPKIAPSKMEQVMGLTIFFQEKPFPVRRTKPML